MQPKSTINLIYLSLIILTATIGGFLFGFDTAVISGTIGFVKKQYGMAPLMEGWFVSSALLGCMIGVAISGKLGNTLGRKKVMLLSAFLFVISAWGCAFAQDAVVLIVFRLIGGVGIGVASAICPMYIAELSPSQLRGKLVTFYQLAITIGILVAYFSNAKIQTSLAIALPTSGWVDLLFVKEVWRGMFAIGIIPAVVFLLMLMLIPESPRWLALKNRTAEAEKILTKISNVEYAKVEMEGIQNSFKDETVTKLTDLFKGAYKKPMAIGILLAALSQFSGINAIIYYGPSILEAAGFKLGDALGGQVTIGIVNTLFTFVAIYFVDRIGRKPLLLWGIGGAVLSLLFASVLFITNLSNGWMVLMPIIFFIACFSFSFGAVTWVVISEIFPTKVRSEAVAISTVSLWIANWVVGQFFPLLLHNYGPAFTFFIFALCSAYAFFLSWKKIPETKGQSLEDIEEFWCLQSASN
ncbi:sugar porter family MFS transporter [Solitalea koreensis]|uniref:MFS transporter, sugar porter (SP) family n=1 Tax=Solitalea koreensis TaxID=543615 RepID=A0A521DLI8_9SPHI|nr:sugar porter family MFS transporter [Solitalea koreensis]SMO71800.1 MFS transporter, sugar porter (SP) family [Solitalea koreensis]